MTEDFTPATPRQKAEFITGMLGLDDKTADAMTRLAVQKQATGWSSLQAEFDALQDAIGDAMGRSRHKHLHPVAWRTKYWWHWHVTSPIIYPLMDLPGALWWHCFRKWTGGTGTWIVSCRDSHLRVLEMTWYEHRRHRKTCQHSIAGDASEAGEKS